MSGDGKRLFTGEMETEHGRAVFIVYADARMVARVTDRAIWELFLSAPKLKEACTSVAKQLAQVEAHGFAGSDSFCAMAAQLGNTLRDALSREDS